MKSCPTCNRTFDDTFTFCLADGSLLSPPFDPQATQRMPASLNTDPPPTEVMNAEALPRTQPAVELKDVPPTIASPQPSTLAFDVKPTGRQYAPAYSGPARKRSMLVWLIPIIGISLLAALLYSLSGRENAGNTSLSNKGQSQSTPSASSTAPSPIPSASTATTTPKPSITPPPPMNRTDSNQRTAQQNSNAPSSSNGQDDQARAVEKVQAILRRNAAGCKINKVLSVSAERTAYGWRVTAKVSMSASGNPLTETAVWNVSEQYGAVPANQLTAEVSHGCS